MELSKQQREMAKNLLHNRTCVTCKFMSPEWGMTIGSWCLYESVKPERFTCSRHKFGDEN